MFEGSVTIEGDGCRATRVVRGTTCVDVTRALALAVAMTLPPDEEPEAPPDEKPPPTPLDAVPARTAAHGPDVSAAGVGANATTNHVQVTAGLQGGGVSAVGPLVAPAFGLYADVARGRGSLRLGIAFAVGPMVERDVGSARFSRTTGTLDVCPIAWGTTWSLRPCAAIEGGSLMANGRTAPEPESVSRWWAALGLATRLR